MDGITESELSVRLNNRGVNNRVAAVACLLLATDYALTYGIVPILPQYFESMNVFEKNDSIQYPSTSNASYEYNNYSSAVSKSKFISMSTSNLQAHSFEIGIVVSIKPAIQVVFSPLAGRWVDKHGVRWPVQIGFLFEIVFCVMFAFSEEFMLFVLARAIQGVASAFLVTSVLSWLNISYSGNKRRNVNGWAFVTIDLGFTLGPPVIGTLYGFIGIYFTMMVMIGLFLLLLLAFSLTLAFENPSLRTYLDSRDFGLIEDGYYKSKSTRSILADKRMLSLAMCVVAVDWAQTGWAPTMPVFMESELDITSPFIIGNIWLVTTIPNLMAVRLFVYMKTHYPQHSFKVSFSAFVSIAGEISVACLLGGFATRALWLLALWMVIIVFSTAGMIYMLNLTVVELVDQMTSKGVASAYGSGMAISMSLALGSTLAPLLSCALMSIGGWKAVNITIAGLYMMTTLCMLPIRDLLNATGVDEDGRDRCLSTMSLMSHNAVQSRSRLVETIINVHNQLI